MPDKKQLKNLKIIKILSILGYFFLISAIILLIAIGNYLGFNNRLIWLSFIGFIPSFIFLFTADWLAVNLRKKMCGY